MTLLRNGHFFPAWNRCQDPLKTTRRGVPWHLPPHFVQRSSTCHTLPHSEMATEEGPGKGDRALREKSPAGGIWGGARWRAPQGGRPSRPGPWERRELHRAAGGGDLQEVLHAGPRRRHSIPQHCQAPLHLGSGQVSSSARGRGHSTGARAAVQGDRLTGQAWPPGHLPFLGVGGSRPGPPLAAVEGRAATPKHTARSQFCFEELVTWETPASPPKTWDMSLTPAPLPPHQYAHLGPPRGYSLLYSSTHPTRLDTSDAGPQGWDTATDTTAGALPRPRAPSQHLRSTDTQKDKAGPHGASLLQLNTSLSLSLFFLSIFP